MEPLSKESLRTAALDARKAFVRTLSDAQRAKLEHRLAQHLTSLFAGVSVVARLSPAGIGDQPAAGDGGSARGRRDRRLSLLSPIPPSRSVSSPATRSSRARSGSCSRPKRHPAVEPDLVLVPLIAIDGARHAARPRQGPLRPRADPPQEEQARGWSGSAGRFSG